jgi:hypothetical protein
LQWPFRSREAVVAGVLSDHQLRRRHLPVYPGVHTHRGIELSAVQRAKATP